MIKTSILLSITLVSVFAALPCFALELDAKQSVGLMGGQAATPVNLSDSALQKAIENLIKQQEKKIDLKKRIPNKLDNPIGVNPLRESDKVLILGGAEAFPM